VIIIVTTTTTIVIIIINILPTVYKRNNLTDRIVAQKRAKEQRVDPGECGLTMSGNGQC